MPALSAMSENGAGCRCRSIGRWLNWKSVVIRWSIRSAWIEVPEDLAFLIADRPASPRAVRWGTNGGRADCGAHGRRSRTAHRLASSRERRRSAWYVASPRRHRVDTPGRAAAIILLDP